MPMTYTRTRHGLIATHCATQADATREAHKERVRARAALRDIGREPATDDPRPTAELWEEYDQRRPAAERGDRAR